MPASRPKHVPDSNILDLRQLLAEQSAAANRPRRSVRWRRSSRRQTASEETWNQIERSVVDWSRARRESLKFIVVAVIVGLPVTLVFGGIRMSQTANEVTTLAQQGLTDLQTGGQAMTSYDAPAAVAAFTEAEATFDQASTKLHQSVFNQKRIASRLPFVGKKFRTATAALTAVTEVARAGRVLSGTLTGVQAPPTSGVTIEPGGTVQGSVGILGPMLRQPQSFRQGLDHLLTSMRALATIAPADVPAKYRETVTAWRQVTPFIIEPRQRGEQIADFLTALFAGDQIKEFLVVFQNHDELRPTGGFIGTFMLVKFEKGIFKVLDAPATGPFDLTAQIPHTSLPPQPILSIAPYWTFHDANWFLDVPTSSDFLMDFYAQARGFKPDGIVYLTPGIVESLLRMTGPVRPDDYGIDITANNFVRATEDQVEFKYNKALNNPKKFLLDLVPTLLEALTKLDATDGLLAAGVTLQHADQADVLFFSRDEATQKIISNMGWSGELLTAPNDYLATVTSNLGGGKTDRVIDEKVTVTVMPQSQGLLHTVAVTRTHRGVAADPLTGLTNRSFLRVYAPANAQFVGVTGNSSDLDFFQTAEPGTKPTPALVAAEGTVLLDQTSSVRLTGESGRKTFGAWSVLPVGQTQTVTFEYTTPLPSAGRWSLVWQKQPGAPRRDWQVIFQAGAGQTVKEIIGNGGQLNRQTATFTTNSDQHRTFGVVIQ